MSGETTGAAAAAAALEGALAQTREFPIPSSADEAEAELASWIRLKNCLGTIAEIRGAVCCWVIRGAFPDQESFSNRILAKFGGEVTPGEAWELADHWELCRQNRQIHEAAISRPAKAQDATRRLMIAVREERARNGVDTTLPLPLNDEDKEVGRILALPAKKQLAEWRKLVAARDAAREGRHPDDIARIQELEAKQQQAERDRAEASGEKKATRAQLLGKYREAATLLGEMASEVAHHLDGEKSLAEHSRKHLELSNDIAVTGVQAVAALIFTEDDDDDR